MKINSCVINDVKLLTPRVFDDARGYFYESFRSSVLEDAGICADFVQDNVSKSGKSVLRGLHYQIINPQDKLVACLSGSILDVAVDLRKDSQTFRHYVAVNLSDENKNMLFVPKGFAHGFLVLSEEAVVSYKCSDYYNQAGERGVRWDDSTLNINWGISEPLLSAKDALLPEIKSLKQEDLF